jgi:hypothetical protein
VEPPVTVGHDTEVRGRNDLEQRSPREQRDGQRFPQHASRLQDALSPDAAWLACEADVSGTVNGPPRSGRAQPRRSPVAHIDLAINWFEELKASAAGARGW